MATSYELMDLGSGNLVGSYRTMDEAFAVIRDSYVLYGWSSVNDLGLVRVGVNGSQEHVALGPELARQAVHAAGNAPGHLRGERTA